MRTTLALAFCGVCALPALAAAQEVSGFEARTLAGTKGLTLPYRLYKVKDPVAGTKYPLILFLHGAGERGDNNTSQLTANAGATVWATSAHQAEHPAYVIAPQCPNGEQWVHTDWTLGSYSTTTVAISDPLTTALEIADAVAEEFEVDPARHYITGLSMGGYGTWDAIIRNPTRFAAALPICGAGDPSKVDLIKDLPLWTFHGDADGTVPVEGSRDMVDALKAIGSDVDYDEYPGVGHDSWTQTYANEEVIAWLFQFEKEAPGAGGGGVSSGGGGAGGEAGTGGSGPAIGGGSGGGSAGTPSSGGSGAGMPSGGSAGSGGGAGSISATPSGSDDSGCSYAPARSSTPPRGELMLLCGFAAFVIARRRRESRLVTR